MTTKIEWCDATWNPMSGCTKVSAGCANCYAERMAKRLAGYGGYSFHDPFRVTLHENRLEQPLHWRKPRLVFLSMGDLFHPDVPFRFIDKVSAVMALCPQHTFQILTKRPERRVEYFGPARFRLVEDLLGCYMKLGQCIEGKDWPLPNVWQGTSVEDQPTADERIEHLCRCPAAVRFVSCEPLLGPINKLPLGHIHWVIVGGETGPGARPMKPEWVHSIRDQCRQAGVPFFFKGWGGVRKGPGNRLLDGREWNEMPVAKGAEA